MEKNKRYLEIQIEKEITQNKKMVFLSGPRQVGKSTLAKNLLESEYNYFLFDNDKFRKKWIKDPEISISNREDGLIVFDELHKDRLWKRKIKGIYDSSDGNLKILVTGSARLNLYRKGSDSLLGRYIPFQLFPFSVAETHNPCHIDDVMKFETVSFKWKDIITYGSFPEPLLKQDLGFSKRWSRLRIDRLVLEDSRDIKSIQDLNYLNMLIDLLPERIGSPLSINSLATDLGKPFNTIKSWLEVLETLYYSFRIKPYSKKIARSLRAETKLYLYDHLQIEDSAKRLENLAAVHLQKACAFWTESAQAVVELYYVRDKEKRESDFLLVKNKKPWILIECKSGDREIDPNLIYFNKKIKPEFCFQLVNIDNFERNYPHHKIKVISYEKFFSKFI